MTQKMQIYKCQVCGNIVEVLHSGAGELVCCGQAMKLFNENTTDGAKEKHVPVIKKEDGHCLVSVGSVPHPMESAHYIEWIEIIDGDTVNRVHLKPGDKPEAMFNTTSDNIVVREYCNLHGLWKA